MASLPAGEAGQQSTGETSMGETSLNDADDIPMTNGDSTAATSLHNSVEDQQDSNKASVYISKPVPYSFDLGNLLINDVNPLPGTGTGAVPDEQLAALARETAQALINQLLTVCTVVKGSATKTTAGPALMLPAPSTALPRAKRVPVARAPTKWEQFAAKKGIAPKAKDGKTVYDDEKGEWVPKWGYKGKNKDGENDWLVEVDEKKENADRERKAAGKGPGAAAAALTDVPVGQTLKRQERKENIRKNERRMKHNEKRARKSASSR